MTSVLSRPASRATGQPAASGQPSGDRRLDLDVVRGIAILLALGWHFGPTPSGNPVLDALQLPGRLFGWAGVDLFFVLSGFLMGQLVLGERARTGSFDGRRFTVRRLLKLWPVLYVFLAVHAVVGNEPLSSYLWQNALHVQNYAGTSLAHLWSLAVEEHFYLGLAVLFPLFARRGGSPRVLVAVLVGVLVTAVALRYAGRAAGVSETRLQWRTHYRIDSLAAGVLLAVARVHAPGAFRRVARLRLLWAVASAWGVRLLATVGKDGALGSTLGFTIAYATAAAFILLLYDAAWVTRARWLTAPVAALGRYSYGIYIWHIFAADLALGRLGLDYRSGTPLAQAVKYGAAIGVGVAATALLERPALRLRERLVPARREGPRLRTAAA
ncbi:MAG: Peptidoglycan/LPS O-acetylase OafA/YrhL, contains acyltransferase and SGNH-hydrolase domain [Blastococcus sp.]|jgi:peptidoglycan/LPS O-acetylase OafA/YrhL|nr:Peptidoglycan/LPS O-acetylase OafA/YrhL, contains acyltransferase and SGNH-hydrolase domain [Blastococcus sp.]